MGAAARGVCARTGEVADGWLTVDSPVRRYARISTPWLLGLPVGNLAAPGLVLAAVLAGVAVEAFAGVMVTLDASRRWVTPSPTAGAGRSPWDRHAPSPRASERQ